jgi:hypothetical protein
MTISFPITPGVRVTGQKEDSSSKQSDLFSSVGSALPADAAASDTPIPL